jgi:chromosome partitioning protein
LVIDTDGQGNATSALGYEPGMLEATTYTLMTRQSTIEETIKQTYFDKVSNVFFDPADQELMQRRKIKPENVLQGPDLLPCNISAARAENELIPYPNWGSLLSDALRRVQSNYDFIFIDTNPGLGKMTVNAFIFADYVVVPTVPEKWPTDGIIILCSSVEEARRINPDLQIAGILFTRVRYAEHTTLMNYMRETLLPQKIGLSFPDLQLSCFQSSINESAAFVNATNRGTSIILSHPVEGVSIAYWGFFAELLQRIEHPLFPKARDQYQKLLSLYKQREQRKAEGKQANTDTVIRK